MTTKRRARSPRPSLHSTGQWRVRFDGRAFYLGTDEDAAMRIAEQLETGTVFMNRCDYLDPELAWVGVKNSGRGCTLSKVGFEQLTRPKSFHFRRL